MGNIELWSFGMYFLLTLLGAYWHWRKMKAQNRVRGTFGDYLWADSPASSMGTGIALLSAAWLATSSGMADWINPELIWALLLSGKLHIASVNTMALAVLNGYSFDSIINKGGK